MAEQELVLVLERDEVIALEAEAAITLKGIDRLPEALPEEVVRARECLNRAYRKVKQALDDQDNRVGEGRNLAPTFR